MNYGKIKLELTQRGIEIKEFCKDLGISEQGFHQMIRNRSMRVEVLESISRILQLPITFWFDCDETNVMDSAPSDTTGYSDVNTNLHKQIDNITKELNGLLKQMAPPKGRKS